MKLRILFLAAAMFMILNPGAATKAHANGDCDDCINSAVDLCSNVIENNQWAVCVNVGLANCVYFGMCPASVIGG